MTVDYSLEALDFLNFKAADEAAFKRAAESKVLSFDAYTRIVNLRKDVVRRTRQLVYEWMCAKLGKTEYQDDSGVHVYNASAAPGSLGIRVVGDSTAALCRIIRRAEWNIDWNAQCKLSGLKTSLPLEDLIGSFPFWAADRLPGHEMVREIKHYFSHLSFNDKGQPYAFNGFLTYSGRLVPVKIEIGIGAKASACIEMHNNR